MGGTLAIEYDVIASGAGNLVFYNARPQEIINIMENGEDLYSKRGKVIPVFSIQTRPTISYSQIRVVLTLLGAMVTFSLLLI